MSLIRFNIKYFLKYLTLNEILTNKFNSCAKSHFITKFINILQMNKKINIKNKRAKFDYYIKSEYIAGIVLSGTEIKSIRESKASISESYCEFNDNNELFIVNMNIELYINGNNFNHKPKARRKLLLNKKELSKLNKDVKKTSLTIIPLNIFINDKGIAKIKVALAQGKKMYDKRQVIKNREIKRNLDKLKRS